MNSDEVRSVIAEWKDAGPKVTSLNEVIADHVNRTDSPEIRRREGVTAILDQLPHGARLIHDGANYFSVRAIFKSWVDTTVGYSAPLDATQQEREGAYEVLIREVDDALGTADNERSAREEREADE